MLGSLAQGTQKQYDCSYKKWWAHCHSNNIDVYKATISQIIGFLSEAYNMGSNYSTLNTHRSALSLLVSSKVEKDENVKRLLKGVFRQRPSLPRYRETWDPTVVLDFLSKMPAVLNLKELSKKLVTLLALTTAHRVQALASIKMKDIHFNSDCVVINISDVLKTSIKTKTNTILRLPFFGNQTVCPAETLKLYIQSTKEIRGDIPYLVITTKKPFKKATSPTISRWIKEVLTESGIDTSIFTSHRTRHASTSKAKSVGVSMEIIKKTAGWSDRSAVFAKHYNLPIVNNRTDLVFANTILE